MGQSRRVPIRCMRSICESLNSCEYGVTSSESGSQASESWTHQCLPTEIDFCQIDDVVGAAIEHGFDHKQAETLDLIDSNRWRHGEFLPADNCCHQNRAVMPQRLLD